MREYDDSGDNSLQDLLSQVPDKHHMQTRHEGALSINGRHPAPLHLWNPDYCGEVDMAITADGTDEYVKRNYKFFGLEYNV